MRIAIVFGFVVSVLAAYFLGQYSARQEKPKHHQTDQSSIESAAEIVQEVQQNDISQGSIEANLSNDVSEAVSELVASESAIAEVEVQATSTGSLESTSQNLVEASNQTKAHIDERQKFADDYDKMQQDWESETQILDYLQLHDYAPQIEVYKSQCLTDRCQLIGQFNGDHELWSEVVEEMSQQDWWDFNGTSSSSSTKDGITYFNLFINKE